MMKFIKSLLVLETALFFVLQKAQRLPQWMDRLPLLIWSKIFFNGKSYFPHRTILKEEVLLKEIKNQGFELIKKQTSSQSGYPDTFVGLFRLT